VALEVLERDLRQAVAVGVVEMGAALQLHEVHPPRLGLAEKDDRGGAGRAAGRLGREVAEVEDAADDGLDAELGRRVRELQRGEEGVGVGEGDGRHRHLEGELGQLLDRDRPCRRECSEWTRRWMKRGAGIGPA
jgi:hypothetical protein